MIKYISQNLLHYNFYILIFIYLLIKFYFQLKSNRKVCKYGYLFIAPPDLELNKTKRWQWRFFIFYDDSELTYSLDENVIFFFILI
jgi:hypothetical protein